jgi:hypothetical protein
VSIYRSNGILGAAVRLRWSEILILSIALAVVGMLFSSNRAFAASTAQNSVFSEEEAVFVHQGLSVSQANEDVSVQAEAAHANIVSAVQKTLGSSYAGVWFNPSDARFAIGVVSAAGRAKAQESAVQAGIGTKNVEEVSVRSTWSQLLGVQEEWNTRLANLANNQEVETGIDASGNAVSVTISSAASANTRAQLEREAEAAKVNVSVKVTPSSTLAVKAASASCYIPFCYSPIRPGVQIRSTVEKTKDGEHQAYCTSGPFAVGPNGYTYMLLAAHCIEALRTGEIDPWFSSYPNGEIGGIGEYAGESAHLNEGGDYAAILINSAFWTLPGDDPVYGITAEWKTNESYIVTGEQESYEGLANCHEGYHSGEQCGTVTQVNSTIPIKYELDTGTRTIYVHGLVRDSACGDEGDSGGPWLSTPTPGTDGQAVMEGTMIAIAGECFATPSYYEPLHTILSNEGLVLLTYYNEVK